MGARCVSGAYTVVSMDLHDAAQRCADAADAAALDAFNRHVKLTRRVAVVHAATLRA